MKCRLLLISFLAVLALFATGSHAYPVINSLSLDKPNLWLGETNTVFLNCTDDNSTGITEKFADITTATAIFPNNPFTCDIEGICFLAINTAEAPFKRVGTFNVNAYCKNALEETVNSSVSFDVSNLSLEISSMISPVYVGDNEEIALSLKKDGGTITSGASFSAILAGAGISFTSAPYYEFSKGWILNFDTSSQTAGDKQLSITAQYGGTSVVLGANLKIAQPIEFSVTSVDKTWVSANDDVIVNVKAFERGVPVQVKKEYVSIQIDSTSANIVDVSPSAGGYAVKFTVPSMPKGSHTLKTSFNYNNYSASDSRAISYVALVSGNIFSGAEKSSQVQIRFTASGIDKTAKADSTGAYSILIPPGTYKINITDGTPSVGISDAEINDFDDGIKYQPYLAGTVRGIQGAGIYFYGIAFEYGSAHLKIPYDQSKISDESQLSAYECTNWNSGKKECSSEWRHIDSKIDTVRKVATFDVSQLNSAYLIGSQDSAGFEASPDKDSYFIDEKISLNGVALDSMKNTIPDALITASIEGTSIRASGRSNAQGVFSIEVPVPASEGSYNLVAGISKAPYLSSEKKMSIAVVRRKELSIVGPDIVRANIGESSEAKFKIINAGQSDLSGLKISIAEVPLNYYQILPQDTIRSLNVNEEKEISVRFTIPGDAAKTTFGASFDISKEGFAKKYSFGLTILSGENASIAAVSSATKNDAESSPALSFGLPTALLTSMTSSVAPSDALYLALFAAASISGALMLRNRRVSKMHHHAARQGNRSMLFEIKKEILGIEKGGMKRNLASRKKAAEYSKRW